MTEAPTLTKGPRAKPLPLLTLTTDADAKGQVDSRILVRWCVSKQLIEKVQEAGFTNPQLVLVVRAKRYESLGGMEFDEYVDKDHIVVPLTQEMAYVRFTRSGKNEIVPVIVNVGDRYDARALGKLRNGHNIYGTVIDEQGKLDYSVRPNETRRVQLKSFSTNFKLEVNVPKEMFAPEPSARKKAFIGRFFRDPKGSEQCDNRKRFLISLALVVPFLVLANLAKVLLTLIAVVLTKREYNLSHFKHPFSGSVEGVIFDTEKDTLFMWQHKNGRRRNPVFYVWNHLTLFALPAIVFGFMQIEKHHGHSKETYKLSYWGWWKTFLVVDGFFVGILVAGLVAVGIFMLGGAIFSKFSDSPKAAERARKRKERLEAARQSADARRREEALRTLSAMVCTTDTVGKAPSLKDLPKNKLTVSLLYNAAKTKVCKPYAK